MTNAPPLPKTNPIVEGFKEKIKEAELKIKFEKYRENGKFIPDRLAKAILKNKIIKTTKDKNETIYVYDKDNGIYVTDGDQEIKEVIQHLTGQELCTRHYKETLFKLRIMSYFNPDLLNQNNGHIHVKNGIIDVENYSIKDFNPDMISTVQIPVTFDPKADCPKIKKFLREVLHENDIPAVQELIGYCLLKDHPYHKAFMFLGEGSNGKSVLLGLIKEFLGRPNVACVALQAICNERNRFAVAELHGKMANIYPDLTSRALYETGKFKALTGGDMLTVERKFGHPFEFVNFSKQMFSANTLPETKDYTRAFFRRWVIINFPNVFEGEDANPKLLKELTTPAELSGLLNWALSGLERLIKKGQFTNSKSTHDIETQYIRASDPLACFVEDCVKPEDGSMIQREVFFARFIQYSKDNNMPLWSQTKVNRRLPYLIHTHKVRKRIGKEKHYCRVWLDIAWKERENEPSEPDSPTFQPPKLYNLNILSLEGKNLGQPGQPGQPGTQTNLKDSLTDNRTTQPKPSLNESKHFTSPNPRPNLNKIERYIRICFNLNPKGMTFPALCSMPDLYKIPTSEVLQVLKHLKESGEIFEPKSGFYTVLK